MEIILKNQLNELLDIYMKPGYTVQLPISGSKDISQDYTRSEIARSDIAYHVEEGNLVINNGDYDLTKLKAMQVIYNAPDIEGPRMGDGRPIMRSDSRPVGYYTMFTMAGDTASGIGDGKRMMWDFSNNDDLVASGIAPSGYKMKRIQLSFLDSIYVKEGCLYFHNAKKNSYLDFSIVCPTDQYYYNRDGTLVQAAEDTYVVRYANKHHFYGDCPMGDELNTESASESAIPSNYEIWLEVYVPESDSDSYGYGELELYRERTYLLPGEAP